MMKAVLFKNHQLSLTSVSLPQLQSGTALIRVLYSGVCNTDLEILQGYLNFQGILGHEFVGVVEACSDESWSGKRVVGEINCGCGICSFCRRGLARHCQQRTVLGISGRDGAHAEYLSLSVANLHVLPERIDDQVGVLVEPLAAAVEIGDQVHLRPGLKVALVGDGKLGQLVARVLRLYPIDLTVIGKSEDKLELLRKISVAVQPAAQIDLPPQDVVVECSGVPAGLALATSLLTPRGTLVLKSTYQGDFPFNPANWVIPEILVVGSRCGIFAPAIRLLQDGLIDTTGLISRVVPASDALAAFALAQEKNMLKVLIDWR